MQQQQLHEIMTQVFTTPNPESGSPPPEHMCWAIFEHGTLFVGTDNELPLEASAEEIEAKARACLEQLGEAVPGSPSADYTVTGLSWFPDERIFMVTYAHPNIMSLIADEAEPPSEHYLLGLQARSLRSADLQEANVLSVRTFSGEIVELS